jgi:hypothetical protein
MEVDEHEPPSKRTKLDSQAEEESDSMGEINKPSFQKSVISITHLHLQVVPISKDDSKLFLGGEVSRELSTSEEKLDVFTKMENGYPTTQNG